MLCVGLYPPTAQALRWDYRRLSRPTSLTNPTGDNDPRSRLAVDIIYHLPLIDKEAPRTLAQGYQDWQSSYIDYSGLKRFIKDRQSQHKWDDADEADFIKALEGELDKVVKFQESKMSELTGKISAYEEEVKHLIAHADASAPPTPTASEAGRHPEELGDDGGSDDDTDDDTEDRFVDLEEDLANVIADVHDLGHFTHLNFTGFVKIVKKHDKRTGFQLRGQFMRSFLDRKPFYKENYDSIIVQLSRLYNLVRTRGHPVMGDSSAGGGQSAFVRQTTKYWVHPLTWSTILQDNYVQLKLVILKHLPVLVFNPDKPFQQEDAAISSIYFDNGDLDLYLGRLEKTEGAEAIRMRWYGGMDVKTIFVERKTHREDWTGEKSVKARFPIKEEHLNDFLAGRYTMDETFEALRKKGKKSDKEIDSMLKLAREVQAAVKHKKLGPVMRTFYNRTAFQLPGDARVRISFDTQLSLIREDNWDGVTRSGDNWRRTDIGIDWPFPQLPDEDKELFPYGVLEVKLQTEMGQQPPEWVRELVSSHLVEAVPKFSKFIHGCATLLPNRVDLVPFWLPQMETDIRKPATRKAQIQRPAPSHTSQSNTPSDGASHEAELAQYTEPVSDDEVDEDDNRHQAITSDEAGWANLPLQAAAEAKAFRDEASKHAASGVGQALSTADASTSANARKQHEIFPKLTPANLSKLLDSKYETERSRGLNERSSRGGGGRENGVNGVNGEEQTINPSGISLTPGRVEYVSSFRAQAGKKVAIPVRVEPKVFYANERTTLSWVEFSVVVSAIGIGILSFSDPHGKSLEYDIALAAASSFTVVALLSLLYTGYTYYWRVTKIRNREAVIYHDYFGPTALCAVLFLAVVVNFSLRIKQGL
ncbi:BZ3500_MvSof-1268-A1-R1_Chr11-3g03553 [Microbotryum saponariae]|uniref:Vacuolar transporter chaperone complex subunit 4 n=1 Tax=Microbotryum saponariae TaxID=289078 RepID=A0A2X0MSQ0_9BASI|nr:BZ3500_MvSof-1268-A1-R1_Chr11-3g03553 [Microbotryum saponariae]SDA03562.1 BZ3501_MvSof-1269-A2-R1_Chr11g03130 [Microbotryum saponariae]